jgi:outer membrane protein assembly factor BamA
MRFVFLTVFAAASLLGQSKLPGDPPSATTLASNLVPAEQPADLNINSRYTIESISFTSAKAPRLSTSALAEMQLLIGSKLNSEALNRLVERIRGELRVHDVRFKLARGGEPDSVKVLLDVDKGPGRFDVSFPKFVYNTRQGWTGEAEAALTLGRNILTFGGISDGDRLVERAEGVRARYESIPNDRVRLAFQFEGYREDYNTATFDALAGNASSSLGAGAYRSRLNFEPSATFVLAKPLTLTVGASFEQLQPGSPAAPLESANAVIGSLRYHENRQSDAALEELDADYSLRAATTMLGTDLAYHRHAVNLRYQYLHGRQSVEVRLVAGVIYGRAPLFERFVLGNSSTLRGWNKYDLDPLGGNRMAYGSVTYGYRIMRVFYDNGSVWDQGNSPEDKQSVGVGLASGLGIFQKGAFLMAVAFPVRHGHAGPVLIAGMNF